MSLHTLSVLVENRPGVLTRCAGLFARRGFNIDSLAVGPTDDPARSRITIRVDCAQQSIDQVTKQLYKLVDVVKVQDVTSDPIVEHELAFIKVRATEANRGEIVRLVELGKGRVVDLAEGSVIVEATGTEREIDELVGLLRSYGIKELVRTGAVVMSRGAASIEEALRVR